MFRPFFDIFKEVFDNKNTNIIEYLPRDGRKKPKHVEGLLLYCLFFYLITLDKKFKKKIVSVMNILLRYSFASMKLEKGHKKLLGPSFKIMLPL